MTTRTITQLFDSYDDAAAAIRAVEDAGIPPDAISLVAGRGDELAAAHRESGNEAAPGAEIGAGVGAVAGGGAGVLAGLGLLAIPGVGPVVAAGWLAALAVGAVGGAAAGGLLGGLLGAGVGKEHAELYTEGVRRGGVLVSVRAPDNEAARVESIMTLNAVDPAARRAQYASAGWLP